MRELATRLAEVLASRPRSSAGNRIEIGEIADQVARLAGVEVEVASGYIRAFFDYLLLLGACQREDDDTVVTAGALGTAAVTAMSLAISEQASGMYRFRDSRDRDEPDSGVRFLAKLEELRSVLPERVPTRVQEYVLVLIKASMENRPAVLMQFDDRSWGAAKFLGGRVAASDSSPEAAALREVREEVTAGRDRPSEIRLTLLTDEPCEYTAISRTTGAYTSYRAHVFGAELDLPEACLREEFAGERGRSTAWVHVDRLVADIDSFAQRQVLEHIVERGLLDSAPLSTERPVDSLREEVFLSYSSSDEGAALRLKDRIENELGLPVFLAPTSIEPGEYWRERLRKSIRSCRVLCVLLSEESLASTWVLIEWSMAWGLGKPVVPVLHGVSARDVPEQMDAHHLVTLDDEDRILSRLTDLCTD